MLFLELDLIPVKFFLIGAVAFLVLGQAEAARAQSQTSQPAAAEPAAAVPGAVRPGAGRAYRALFGGATTDPSMHKSLDLTVSIAEAYDDNTAGYAFGGGLGPTSPLLVSGFYTNLVPSLEYRWIGRHATLTTNFGSDLRYYASEGEFIGSSHYGAVGFSSKVGRGELAASQSLTYSPSYFYGVLPSLEPTGSATPVVGQALSDDHAYFSDSAINFSQDLSSRSRLTALAQYRLAKFPDDVTARDLQSYALGGRYGYELSRNTTLHLGYVYRTGEYSYVVSSRPTVVHDLDIGVDYHRPISLSRRTHFDFSVGSSIVSVPNSATTTYTNQLGVVGSATLSRDMGRTWRAQLAYHRGAGFAAGFNEPVFSDAAVASIEGFFSRRVDFHGEGGFSDGSAGNTSAMGNDFRTYNANVRLRVGITAALAVYGEYLYYSYDVGEAVLTAAGVPKNLDRNSARLGLTLWLPLVRK